MQNITRHLLEYKKTSNKIQNFCILSVNVKEKLSELFRRRMKDLGLRNIDLANKTGLSRSYVGNIVNETAPTQSGQYNLSSDSVSLFAKALEISESEILEAMNYLSKNSSLPDGLEPMDFDGLDASDIKDIRDFINFKKSQKEKPAERAENNPKIDHDYLDHPAYSKYSEKRK